MLRGKNCTTRKFSERINKFQFKVFRDELANNLALCRQMNVCVFYASTSCPKSVRDSYTRVPGDRPWACTAALFVTARK